MATSRELAEQAFSLLQDALKDSETRATALDAELKKQRTPKNQLEQQARVLEHRLATTQSESEKWRREALQLQEILENERAKARQLKKKLQFAETGPEKVGKKEVNYWRSRAEQFDSDTEEYRQRITELGRQLAESGSELEKADARAAEQIRTRDAQLAELTARLAGFEAEAVERQRQIEELSETRRIAREERQSAQEMVVQLQEELREEKECTVNLSEIANERHDQISVLSEKLDEALERFEEAKWQLERASRFERLVNKRRKLIDSLIDGLRARHKSNTALKAGLDGLRKFKARSEEQQQKLLLRVDELSGELKEARERLSSQRDARRADDKLRLAAEKISAHEDRLNAQVQVIDKLESELSAARATRQSAENQAKELTEIRAELEKRNNTIAELEKTLDEQQAQLAKLRGSQSETLRLKAMKEQDQTLIDDLNFELDHLKAELKKRQDAGGEIAPNTDAETAGEIRRRDSQISDLKRKLKDQEKEIAKLNDAVSGWQKKYEFLSADEPSAYQSGSARASGEK